MATKKTKKELNLEKSIEEFYKVSGEARKNCKEFLLWALKKYGKKTVTRFGHIIFAIDFECDIDNDGDENVSLNYDGGNHPENSNCYSMVHSVYLDLGTINARIDEEDAYEFERINTADLLAICECIKSKAIPRLAESK
jgi:hypothetical protein